MRLLTLGEALEIYRRVMQQSGGTYGVRDLGALQSALAQPRMTFGGQELYPSIVDKAAALAFSIIRNHPFVDGNKRAGHAAMEVFLILNGYAIEADIGEQERIVLGVAKGDLDREVFTTWLGAHVVEKAD
jgi:death-on-curing protein